jgi:hypothetical protein
LLPPHSPDFNPIEQLFAKLKSLLRKAAEPGRGPLEPHRTTSRCGRSNDRLDDFHFGLLAQLPKLMEWAAGSAPDIDPPLLRHPIILLVDADNFSFDEPISLGTQFYKRGLTDTKAAR